MNATVVIAFVLGISASGLSANLSSRAGYAALVFVHDDRLDTVPDAGLADRNRHAGRFRVHFGDAIIEAFDRFGESNVVE